MRHAGTPRTTRLALTLGGLSLAVLGATALPALAADTGGTGGTPSPTASADPCAAPTASPTASTTSTGTVGPDPSTTSPAPSTTSPAAVTTTGGTPDPSITTSSTATSTATSSSTSTATSTATSTGTATPSCPPGATLPGEMDPADPLPPVDPVPPAAEPAPAPAALVTAAGAVPKLGRAPLLVGATGPRVVALQTRLVWAGIETPVDGTYETRTAASVKLFQAKRRLAQTGQATTPTLRQLLRATKRGDRLDERCYAPGKVICVDKTQKVLRFLRDGVVKRQMHINIGPERGDRWYGRYSSTREGSFAVYKRAKYHISTGYGTPMPYSLWFDGGEAFHLSRWFGQYGYANTSFGCVTAGTQADARWLFRRTPVGTPFVVYS